MYVCVCDSVVCMCVCDSVCVYACVYVWVWVCACVCVCEVLFWRDLESAVVIHITIVVGLKFHSLLYFYKFCN